MSGMFQLILALGPGAYLLGRWQLFRKEPSRDALIVVLLWTYLMLCFQYFNREELSDDHKTACQQLERLLVEADRASMEDPGSVNEWDACYRHSTEYLEGEADYRANESANR